MFRFFFGVHLRRSITWELLFRWVADCPPLGYRVARQAPLFEVRLCLSVCIVPVTVLPSSIYSILTSAIPKMFLSVCQPDHMNMNIAFVGNAGHLHAVIDLVGSEGLAGPRVNYYIGHLSLNKDSLFADPLEWIAEFKFPRLVLLSNTSRGGYSSEKAGFS